MNWSTVWHRIAIIGVFLLVFLSGWLTGNRVWISNQVPYTVRVRESNGAEVTTLSQVRTTSLFSRLSPNDIRAVGTLFYLSRSDSVDFFIDITSLNVNFTDGGQIQPIPISMTVYGVSSNVFMSNSELIRVGELQLERVGDVLVGKFSGVLAFASGLELQRLVLLGEGGVSTVPPFVLSGVQESLLSQAPPYLWSDPLVLR